MSNITAEEFESLLKKFFGFLIDQYGFVMNKKGDLSYDFENATTRVRVFAEFNSLVVGMEPIGEEARKLLRDNIVPEQLGVSVIARGLNPDLDYKVMWDEPIPSAMERRSQLLETYCQEFLKGDFSRWTQVLESKNTRR